LQDQCRKAKEQPSFVNTFLRYHCNTWTQQEDRWLDMGKWDACAEPFDSSSLEGMDAWCGLDLSATTDLTAFSVVVPWGDEYYVLPYFFIPEDNMPARERRDRVGYQAWARHGHIEATPGNVVDYEYVRERIREIGEQFSIQEIAFDPWNSTQFAQQLQDEDGFNMVEFRQGYRSMSGPSKDLERLIMTGRLRHGGHPVLRWNADSVAVAEDPAGNLKPVKPRREQYGKRIDGIVATVMALGRAMLGQGDIVGSYLDGGGELVIV